MKKITLVLALIVVAGFIHAQSSLPKSQADSLWMTWNNSALADTTRFEALRKFTVEGYVNAQYDSAFYYGQLLYDFAVLHDLKKKQPVALYIQATALYKKSEFRLSLDYHSRCLKLREELGDRKGMAASLTSMATIYKDLGDYPTGIEYFNRSLKIREEINDQTGIANCLNGLGVIYGDQGNYALALESYTRSLAIREKMNDKKGIAGSLINMAYIYSVTGDYTKALTFYAKGLVMLEETGDKRGESAALHSLGRVHKDQGDYSKAMFYYLKSLALCELLGDRKGIVALYNDIGNVYYRQGDLTMALDYYKRSLALLDEIGTKRGLGALLANIGNIYHKQGDDSNAIDFFMRSLEVKKELGDQNGVSLSLNSLGDFYKQREDFLTALSYYEQALEIREEIGYKKGISNSLANIGAIYFEQQNYVSAILYGSKSFQLADQMNLNAERKEAARLLYLAHLRSEHNDSAFVYLTKIKSIADQDIRINYFTLSENEKQLYFSTIESDYESYYDFALRFQNDFPGLADSAYNIALKTKSLALKSSTAMRNFILSGHDSLLIADYESWIALKKKIASLYSEGGATRPLENEANELEKSLIKRSAVLSDFNRLQNLDWKNVRDHLKEGECAIEFVRFKSEVSIPNEFSYAGLLVHHDSEHPEFVRLCNETELSEIMGKCQGNNLHFVNELYGTRSLERKGLYNKIWQPLEKSLRSVKTVYYSPAGLLNKISFSSIAKEQDVLLSDTYQFRQMNSTGNVVMAGKSTLGELENFLLMGGITYNDSANAVWSYLPGSRTETEAIYDYVNRKKYGINYFHSENASEEIFKEKIVGTSIVHIATHGFFFPDPDALREELKQSEVPEEVLTFRGNSNSAGSSNNYATWSFLNNKNPLMRSGIVLAGANEVWNREPLAEGEDGVLTAMEVSHLDLRNTKLVVLSACETGLGDIKGSEGVYGLQRAFKMAGVKYLIMSLWQVPDKETSEFMQLFYKNLLKLKDIPKAFQKTQKIMRQKYDPYYWGAFVLIA
jgi:CHAT domain-containing protein